MSPIHRQNLKTTNCPLCTSSLYEVVLKAKNIHGSALLGKDQFTWARCTDCRLYYLSPRPKEKFIWQYYPTDYYSAGIKIPQSILDFYRRLYNSIRLKFVKKYCLSGNRLLDLGCGQGGFVKVAKVNGFEAFGVDPQTLRKKLKNYKFKSQFFDAVTLWHVLEHFYNPGQELLEIKRVLKKDGRLFLALPNFASIGFLLGKECWYHLDTPRHLIGFDKKTIVKMLNGCGFRVVKINYFPFERPSDLAETIALKIFGQNNFLKALFFLPILAASFVLKAVSPLFGLAETMQIVACKNE